MLSKVPSSFLTYSVSNALPMKKKKVRSMYIKFYTSRQACRRSFPRYIMQAWSMCTEDLLPANRSWSWCQVPSQSREAALGQ